MRRFAVVLALAAGCSWQLAPPSNLDASSDAPAARDDRSMSNDLPTPDVSRSDGAPADRPDVVGLRDVVDAPPLADRIDVAPPTDGAVPADLVDVAAASDLFAAPDVVTAPDAVTPRDVVVDVGFPECVPGTRRGCYTGPPSSRGVGVCRDGVQTCLATGRWPTACEGQILPDCTGRVCGSDGCGGSCGTCSGGPRCDDTGRCVAPVCGASNFSLTCPDSTRCPRDSRCDGGGRCVCDDGFAAVSCGGAACGACAFPDWWCERRYFCGAGTIACPGGWLCPVRSRCVDATRGCACDAGFVAVDCDGNRCTSCPGVGYRCVPP